MAVVGITRTKHEAGGHNERDPYGYRTARDAEAAWRNRTGWNPSRMRPP